MLNDVNKQNLTYFKYEERKTFSNYSGMVENGIDAGGQSDSEALMRKLRAL